MEIADYLMVCLNEECAEIIKITDKILRFGPNDTDPNKCDGVTNREKLITEIMDLFGVLSKMDTEDVIFGREISDTKAVGLKIKKLEFYMERSRKNGRLTG